MDGRLGQLIDDRYRIVRLLGEGGMGIVYEAEHTGLAKRVAIKFLADGADRERFRREARVAAKFVHGNVVQILDVGDDYLTMELVEGRDLRALIDEGPMPAARAVAIGKQILAGLGAIHDAGIVHRDIKPANVMLGAGDVVKVMDFGVAKPVAGGTLTDTGKVVGTPAFMAPEQLAGVDVDGRADLYAVGMTLYAMLAGRAPFTAGDAQDPLEDVPPPVARAVMRALDPLPSRRFPDARAFAAALDDDDARSQTATLDVDAADVIADRRSNEAMGKTATPQVRAEPPPRRGWILLLPIAGALVVIAVFAIGGPNAPAPIDARPITVIDAARDRVAEQRAIAKDAENRGDLDVAISAYQEIYRLEPGADPLYRVAELEERIGNRMSAARYFRRYLEAAPNAADRERVLARIAELDPPPLDAGVADAHRSAPAAVRHDCFCMIDHQSACPRLQPQSCHCEVSDGVSLCITRPVDCGKTYDSTCTNQLRCTSETTTGVHDAACAGYYTYNGAKATGTLRCSYCPNATPAEIRVFDGPDGTACSAFSNATGERASGRALCP